MTVEQRARRLGVHVILIGLRVIGIADVAAHGKAQ